MKSSNQNKKGLFTSERRTFQNGKVLFASAKSSKQNEKVLFTSAKSSKQNGKEELQFNIVYLSIAPKGLNLNNRRWSGA